MLNEKINWCQTQMLSLLTYNDRQICGTSVVVHQDFLTVTNLYEIIYETRKVDSLPTNSFPKYMSRESNSEHMFKRVIYHLDQSKSIVGYPF